MAYPSTEIEALEELNNNPYGTGTKLLYDHVVGIYQALVDLGIDPLAALDITNLKVAERGWTDYSTGDYKTVGKFPTAKKFAEHIVDWHGRLYPDSLKAKDFNSYYKGIMGDLLKSKYNPRGDLYKEELLRTRPGVKKRINAYRDKQGLPALTYNITNENLESNYAAAGGNLFVDAGQMNVQDSNPTNTHYLDYPYSNMHINEDGTISVFDNNGIMISDNASFTPRQEVVVTPLSYLHLNLESEYIPEEERLRLELYNTVKEYYDNRPWYSPSKVIDNLEGTPILGIIPSIANQAMGWAKYITGNGGEADYFFDKSNLLARKQLLPLGIAVAQATPAAPYVDAALSDYLLTDAMDRANASQGWDWDTGLLALTGLLPVSFNPWNLKNIRNSKNQVKEYLLSEPYILLIRDASPGITDLELSSIISRRVLGVDNSFVFPIPKASTVMGRKTSLATNYALPENSSFITLNTLPSRGNINENLVHELLHSSHGYNLKNLTAAELEQLRLKAGTLVPSEQTYNTIVLQAKNPENVDRFIEYLNLPEEEYAWPHTKNIIGNNSYANQVLTRYFGN